MNEKKIIKNKTNLLQIQIPTVGMQIRQKIISGSRFRITKIGRKYIYIRQSPGLPDVSKSYPVLISTIKSDYEKTPKPGEVPKSALRSSKRKSIVIQNVHTGKQDTIDINEFADPKKYIKTNGAPNWEYIKTLK